MIAPVPSPATDVLAGDFLRFTQSTVVGRAAMTTVQKTKKAAGSAAASASDHQIVYFGYLNSGAALSASLVVFILATHLSLAVSWVMATEFGDTAT